MTAKKPGWSQVKAVLADQEPKEILKVVNAARHMGWGYYDCSSVLLDGFWARNDE